MITLGAETWIPGHGKPTTPDTARLYQKDLAAALERARKTHNRGVKKEDAMKEWNSEELWYCCLANIWKRSLPGLWDETVEDR